MTNSQTTYDSILDIIQTWPPNQRYLLIQDVLKTLEPQDESRGARDTLGLALGLLTTERPTPTDEEIAQWLEERRLEKYSYHP
jgi:hypothetical protein